MISGRQMRAARGLIGWSQHDLAREAGVGIATIRRYEGADTDTRGAVDTLIRIQRALEQAGIKFIEADETGGEGLRLKG